MDVPRKTVGSYNQTQHTDALIFRLACFFRELRLGLVNGAWWRDSAADMENSSAGPAAFATRLGLRGAQGRNIAGIYQRRHISLSHYLSNYPPSQNGYADDDAEQEKVSGGRP